jgi:hypothetical protein
MEGFEGSSESHGMIVRCTSWQNVGQWASQASWAEGYGAWTWTRKRSETQRSAAITGDANGATPPFWVLFVGIEVKNFKNQGRHTVTGTVNSGRSAVSQTTRYNPAAVPASAVRRTPDMEGFEGISEGAME